MKKLAAVLMVLGALVMGGSAALAYPPGAVISEIVRGSPGPPGGLIRVRITGCLPGEEVVFTLPGNGRAPVRVVCTPEGTAEADLVHGGRPGTYTGNAQLVTSQLTVPFTIVTTPNPPGVTVPATGGGENSSSMLGIGAGAAALGVGLVLVARQRRRQPATA